MNQANNAYSAFDAGRRSRGKAHSTASFKKAWRRVAVILRGGPVKQVDRRLKALGLPALRGVKPGPYAGFVRRLFGWVRSHRRVKLMLYNQGALADGPFRLNRYPRAKAEIRRQLKRG